MADLPRIFARPDLPFVGLPRTNPNNYGAQVFGTLAQVTAAMAEKQKPIDAARQASEYDIAMEDLKNQVAADPDPNTWRDTFMQREAELRARILENTPDAGVKEAFELHRTRNLARHTIDISQKGIKASHLKQLGDIEIVGNTLAQQAANTLDEGLRATYINTYNGMLAAAAEPTAIGGLTVPGALTAKDVEQRRLKFAENVEKGRAYAMIERDPDGLIEALKTPANFAVLTGPERNALKNHAEETINRRKRLAKEAEQERVDQLNTNLLEKNVAGQLTIGEVLSIPDDVLGFKNKQFWVDRMTQQAKEEGKEKDPFEKSDGATRAQVLAGVLGNPSQWPTEKILGYMGQGLSTTHALQLVNIQKDLIKDKTGNNALKKYDPLNTALSTLDGLRRSYAFTKEGQDEKVTDANAAGDLRLKNDEAYQRVVDEVIRRSQGGEDPRMVMQQLMKPYFEQKTKGWFESISNWFTAPMQTTDKTVTPPNLATAETIQTPSGPIRIDKNLSPQERQDIIKKFGGSARSPEIVAAEKKQIEGLNRLDAASARYRTALEADPDEAAREFLARNGKLITPDTLNRAKQYLKNRPKPVY